LFSSKKGTTFVMCRHNGSLRREARKPKSFQKKIVVVYRNVT
jgi:hypothetical protein